MQPGNLRTPITFQYRAVTGKDSSGGDIFTWVAFSPNITRSSSKKPLKGREVFEARADYGEDPVSFVVRYDPTVATVTDEHRILDVQTGEVFAIHSIQNWRGLNEWLEFWTTTGTKDQD